MTERQLQVSIKSVGFALFFGGWAMMWLPNFSPGYFKALFPGWYGSRTWGWIWSCISFGVIGVGACLGSAIITIQKKSPDFDTAGLKGQFDEQLTADLEAATKERNASRLVLIRRLVTATGLEVSDARKVVDDYCDRHAPDLPITL